jgi:hypothetical protein
MQLFAELTRDIAGIAHIGNARTAWRSSPRMLTVRSVKKILIVVMLGGLLLAVFLFAHRKGTSEAIASDPAATTAAAVATAAPAQAQAPAAQATAAAATTAPPSAPAAPVASDTSACARLSELCSTSDQHVNVAECEKELADARKMSGANNVARSEQCIADAKTCAAASGCISGGVGMGAMGEFLKGFGSALSH